ncbi:MAG: O-antigen ligase family protein [Gammaproteobacteria bacterium]
MKAMVESLRGMAAERQRLLLVAGILMFMLLPLQSSGMAVALSLMLLVGHYRQRDVQAVSVGGLWGVAVAIGVMLLASTAFSHDPAASLKAIGKVVPAFLFLWLLLQAMRRSVLNDGSSLLVAAGIAALVAVVIFLSSQVWYGGYVSRIEGLTVLPARNGTSVALLFVLCAVMAVYQVRHNSAILMAGLLLLWIIMANGGRGALVGALAVVGWTIMRRYRLRVSHMLLTALAGLVIAGTAVWWWGLPSGLERAEGGVLTGRGSLWLAAVQVIREQPWFGIGINVWKSSPYVHSLSNGWINQPSPHNFVLDILTSVGVVGTLSCLMACGMLGWRLRAAALQVAPEFRAFGWALLVGFLVNALVDFRVFSVQFVVAVGVGMLLAFAGKSSPRPGSASPLP